MDEFTTIRITKTTRDRLKKIGTKEEEYEDLLNRLMDIFDGSKKV